MFRKSALMAALAIGIFGPICMAESYSCRADLFMPDAYGKKPIVWSPDHAKYVRLWSTPEIAEPDEGVFSLSIYSGDRLLKTFTLQDLSAGTFVKWSPDSKAFYIMWSDGGAIGGYHVRAFVVGERQAVESLAPKAVAADFAKHHYCKTRGNNLYAVRWVNGSKELLLRPEVYPTSDCAPETALSAEYLVKTEDGKIVEKGTVKEMTAFSNGCPSDVFPSAFATQNEVEEYRKLQPHDQLPKH